MPGAPATPFCTSLAGKACNPMYRARRRPCAQSNNFQYVQFLLISMFMYIHICMLVQDIVLPLFPASTDEPPRFHVPIFSSFFFSKDRRLPHVQVCRGDREYGHQQATFEVASCGKEYNSEKLSCETLSKFILNMRLFFLNNFSLVWKTCTRRNLVMISLRSFFRVC